jgi:4-diphosphocytidyl-2-C-methyl-D-erythritol kinase
MPTRVRSYSKINLGLAIGPPRQDGFHSLATLYQTLALHDLITVSARTSPETSIILTSNDLRVPTDSRNTVWKMVDVTLNRLGITASVDVFIQKNLPIQGGMGAGSANAAAALIGLEKELGLDLPLEVRLDLAAQVGSDVPLFLVGGSVLGSDRGQCVAAVPDITFAGETVIPCVVALPGIGVSTPLAFREWDRRFANPNGLDLHNPPIRDTLYELSRTFATVFRKETNSKSGASGIFPDPGSVFQSQSRPEKLHGLPREQLHGSLNVGNNAPDTSGLEMDLAENSLLALVRTGSENQLAGTQLENDFETVVFPQYPLLRDIKRHLMGSPQSETGSTGVSAGNPAIYAALSGSGSALFGLYRTQTDATEAQQRLQQHGVKAIVTATMPRPLYWTNMFAE